MESTEPMVSAGDEVARSAVESLGGEDQGSQSCRAKRECARARSYIRKMFLTEIEGSMVEEQLSFERSLPRECVLRDGHVRRRRSDATGSTCIPRPSALPHRTHVHIARQDSIECRGSNGKDFL